MDNCDIEHFCLHGIWHLDLMDCFKESKMKKTLLVGYNMLANMWILQMDIEKKYCFLCLTLFSFVTLCIMDKTEQKCQRKSLDWPTIHFHCHLTSSFKTPN